MADIQKSPLIIELTVDTGLFNRIWNCKQPAPEPDPPAPQTRSPDSGSRTTGREYQWNAPLPADFAENAGAAVGEKLAIEVFECHTNWKEKISGTNLSPCHGKGVTLPQTMIDF